MSRSRHILLLIIITIIVSILIGANTKDYQIGSILGRALALIFGPYLIASLIKHRLNISSWNLNFDDKSFKKTFIIVWVIYVILNFVGSNTQ